MNRRHLWLLLPFVSFACADDEGSTGQATTAGPGDPSASQSATNAPSPATASSSAPVATPPPSATVPPASAEPSSEPEPSVDEEPEPNLEEPEPFAEPESPGPEPSDEPEPDEPEPSFEPNGGAGASGPSPGLGGSGAMSNDGGMSNGGTGAMTSEPEPLEGCEDGPLDAPLPDCAPEFEETGDFYEDCVARINQLRWECQCLPPLERWPEGEDCADQHAQYDYEQDEAHAGISDGICENGGGSQNECPDYNPNFDVINFCLQQMWDEGPGEDFQAHGHYINMSSTTVTKVACGLYVTPEGNFWSVQNFTR